MRRPKVPVESNYFDVPGGSSQQAPYWPKHDSAAAVPETLPIPEL